MIHLDPTVQTAIVGVIGAVAVAVVTPILNRRANRRIDEVHEQVKNTHTTNLREDIDRVVHLVERLDARMDRFERRIDRLEDREEQE